MLKKYPNLKNPPIVEVVVGISIELSMEEIDILSKSEELKKQFPIKKEIKVSSIEGNEQGIKSINDDINGYLFQNEDNLINIFLEKNRIAYSIRNKYISFEELKENYINLVNIFQKKLPASKQIKEIGLRYINKVIDIQDTNLFKIQLIIKKEKIIPFVVKFNKDNNNIKSTIIATLGMKDKSNNKYDIILDINTHTQISSLDDIENSLDIMREEKNEIFFSSFDKKLIELWEK